MKKDKLTLRTEIQKDFDNETIKNINIARRSIVALKPIKKGEAYNDKNIYPKRPGNGISPIHWDNVIGKKAKKDYKENELIEW